MQLRQTLTQIERGRQIDAARQARGSQPAKNRMKKKKRAPSLFAPSSPFALDPKLQLALSWAFLGMLLAAVGGLTYAQGFQIYARWDGHFSPIEAMWKRWEANGKAAAGWPELRSFAACRGHSCEQGVEQQKLWKNRTPEGQRAYDRYKAQAKKLGVKNAEFVLKHTAWPNDGLALAPNYFPYNLERGVEHFILWHHPETAPVGQEVKLLDPEQEFTHVKRILNALE